MKKTFIVLAAVLMAMTAKAWEVGDFYDQDPTGVPAIVAYVDESGEHGLIMAPRFFTENAFEEEKKAADKRIEYLKRATDSVPQQTSKKGLFAMSDKINTSIAKGTTNANSERVKGEMASLENYNKTATYIAALQKPKNTDEIRKGFNNSLLKHYIDDLASGNTEFGETNTSAIADYCAENGIDVSAYFPEVNYSILLGEGWYVAGNHEFELISRYFTVGLGKKAAVSYKKIQPKIKAIEHKLGYLDTFFPILKPQYSSTMLKSGWTEENKDKTEKIVYTGADQGLGVLGQAIMAVVSVSIKDTFYAFSQCKTDAGAKIYYAFISNYEEDSPSLIVKKF